MKKIFFLSFFFSFTMLYVIGQPTKAEIDKMMKQAQDVMKKYGKDSTVNNAMKDAQNKQKQMTDVIKNQQGNNNATPNAQYSSDPGSYGNVDNWKFPAKNTALLSSLPKKVFTKAELINFLNDIYSQLSKKLAPGISSSVNLIATKYNNDANKMADAALAGWYTNYQQEALLLIIKAAANDPENGVLLNNCAALLNMSGIEQKAIPILKYILQSYPGSAMVLNNLGQAYAGLGDTDTAMVYLGRCIKIQPENSEANNTAGQIEATKGNKGKAAEYFEKSIKGAYTKTAELKLSKIKKGSSIVPLVRPRVKLPEYFNMFKYDLPQQCTNTNNAATAKAEHEAFREMITKQSQMYGAKYAEATQMKTQEAMQIMNAGGMGRPVKKDEFMAQPYYGLCVIMARDILAEYQNELNNYFSSGGRGFKKYSSEWEALENEYQSKHKILSDAGAECGAMNNLANQYLPKFAYITEEWQKKNMLVFSTYFDELVYWHYLVLHPTGMYDFKIRYYEFIEQYLVNLGSICQTKIIEPCEFKPTTANKDSNAINEMDCPLEIEIPFVVGKFEVSCEKFSFKAGEGAVFGYEKNFKTHQSTVSVGIGAKLELEGKVGPVKGGVSVSAGETIFITFDGENKFADGGLKFDAKATAGIEAEAGKAVKGKKDILKEETGVGYTLGINSGWDFNEGPFKGMIGPAPEVPLNKNVKIYKPNN